MDSTQPVTVPQPADELESTVEVEVEVEVKPLPRPLRFTDLPGEIRNLIYDFVSTDNIYSRKNALGRRGKYPRYATPLRDGDPRCPTPIGDGYPVYSRSILQNNWETLVRQDLGFLMSCRMIYQEYRPDYDAESSHEHFHIWLPYMTELVAQRERCNQPLFLSNPCYIRAAAYRVEFHIPTKPELKIDITPLLRACQRQPELRLKFDLVKVDNLFDRTNEQWWKYFDEKVAEVSVFPRGLLNTEVHVVVKAGEGED